MRLRLSLLLFSWIVAVVFIASCPILPSPNSQNRSTPSSLESRNLAFLLKISNSDFSIISLKFRLNSGLSLNDADETLESSEVVDSEAQRVASSATLEGAAATSTSRGSSKSSFASLKTCLAAEASGRTFRTNFIRDGYNSGGGRF